MNNYKIIQKNNSDPNSRWIIVDLNDKILDNAGGHGFKTKQSALKAAWYKFQSGKDKIYEIKSWWKKNKSFARKLSSFGQDWFKEIARDEINFEEEAVKLSKEMNVEGFDVKFLKYMER